LVWGPKSYRAFARARQQLHFRAAVSRRVIVAAAAASLLVASVAIPTHPAPSTVALIARKHGGSSSSPRRVTTTTRKRTTTTTVSRTTVPKSTTTATATTTTMQQPVPPAPDPNVPSSSAAPPRGGYFALKGVGSWSTLPSGAQCKSIVHSSTWEPRTVNTKRNHTLVDASAVHASLAARPYDDSFTNWNSWLIPRVDGQYEGTTDEIFQWGACKWGLPDDLIRAIAVQESTWYQYETYPSGRCVLYFSCGDIVDNPTAATQAYCNGIAKFGYDYQPDFGAGVCPETFGIVGVMSYQDPAWGPMKDNQNGTFPFNRDSTAFAVDYLGSFLRGCFEGWITWLGPSGDLWGCVGAWFSGDWYASGANNYIASVQNEMKSFIWLDPTWPQNNEGCSKNYGCPGADKL
jgi:hypothetical protein